LITHIRRAGLLCALLCSASLLQAQNVLSLSAAIDLAIRKNPAIKKAGFEIAAAEARALIAGRIPNPTLGVSWNEASSLTKPGDGNERDFLLAQAIEFPTKRSARIDVASAEVRIRKLEFDRTVTVVKSLVARSFYRLFYSQRRTEQLALQLDLMRDLEKLVTARYGANASSYLDMVRTKIERARLGNDLVEARTEHEARQRELSLMVGIESAEIRGLAGEFPSLLNIVDPDSAARSLAAGSILLKSSLEATKRQEYSMSLAKSSYVPDVQIGVANQRRGNIRNLWGIELQASIPLWFWQEPRGQVNEAAAQIQMATVDRLALDRQVVANVRDALGVLSAAETQLLVFDRTLLADARDIVDTANKQYQNGQMDILNLLEVFRTYRATQAEYLRAQFNHAIAVSRLVSAAELPPDEPNGFGVQQ